MKKIICIYLNCQSTAEYKVTQKDVYQFETGEKLPDIIEYLCESHLAEELFYGWDYFCNYEKID